MAFAPAFGRPFSGTFDRHAAAAAGPAWYAGLTIAYQPKGAASYAASKVNLANPGTYDAGDGAAYPTWASGAGWSLNGTDDYLTTGWTPADTDVTIVVRFANVAGSGARGLIGSYSSNSGASLIQINNAGVDLYNGQDYPTGYIQIAPAMTAGVYGFAAKQPYRDGVAESSTIPVGSGTFLAALVGAININGSAGNFFSGDILAVAIKAAVMTAGEIATLSAAMAAL